MKVEEISLISTGKNTEKAFSEMTLKLSSKIIDPEKVEPNLTKTLLIRQPNLKALLYNYLKGIYNLITNEAILIHKVPNIKIETLGKDYFLTAVIQGDKLNESHEIKNKIKLI